MSIENKISSMEKKLNKIDEHSSTRPVSKNEPVEATSGFFKVIELILYPFLLFYIFLKVGFIGVDWIGSLIANSLSFLQVKSVFGIFSGDFYLGMIVLVILFFIYFNIFALFPLTYFLTIRSEPLDKIYKQIKVELIIVVCLMIPLFLAMSYGLVIGDDGSMKEDTRKFNINLNEKIENLKSGPLCYLFNSPIDCMQNQETTTAKKTTRAEYNVYFKTPDYNYVQNLEKFKQRPYYLNYEIKAKGSPLYLDKIECYANRVDDKNLLYRESLENRKIETNQRLPVSDIKCDLNELTIDGKIDEDFKLITLLYYEIESQYTQSFYVYNVDKYIETNYGNSDGLNIIDIEEEIRKKLNIESPIKSNNYFDLKVYTSPKLPFFVGKDYDDNNIYMSFTFTKDSVYDKVLNNTLINYSLPNFVEMNCDDTNCNENIENLITSYNEESNIELNLLLKDNIIEREALSDKINFNIKSNLVKKNVISLVINNPDYVEEEENNKSDVNLNINDFENENISDESDNNLEVDEKDDNIVTNQENNNDSQYFQEDDFRGR
ncbi:MAG: hypothetical protein ACOC16_00210 [Nanoarchaeota archaeon]